MIPYRVRVGFTRMQEPRRAERPVAVKASTQMGRLSLVCLLYLVRLQLAATTSQSSPVWVPSDDPSIAQSYLHSANQQHLASDAQLQVSSSSHEPSIVSLDQSERRLDQQTDLPVVAPSSGHQSPSEPPNPGNQTNAHVQFDPDEPVPGANQPSKPATGQHQRNNRRTQLRRQDLNNETSSPNEVDLNEELNNSSQHEPFDNYLLNEFIRSQLQVNSSLENNTQTANEEQPNKEDSLKSNEPTVELEPSPILIPMTSVQTAFSNNNNNSQRRKLHTAGTQYDFRDNFPGLEQNGTHHAVHEDADIAVAFAGNPTTSQSQQSAGKWPSQATDLMGAERQPEFYNNDSNNNKFGFHQENRPRLPGGGGGSGGDGGLRPRQQTNAIPQWQPAAKYHHFGAANEQPVTSDKHHGQFWTSTSQGTRRENLVPWRQPTNRRAPSFNYHPQAFGNLAHGEPALSWHFSGINHQGSSNFLRPYAGPMLFGGRAQLQYRPRPPTVSKPKRSLLSSLGSRINSWVSEPAANNGFQTRPFAASFEDNFWSHNRPAQRLRLRPPTPPSPPWQKASNFYLVNQPAASNQIRFPSASNDHFNFYPSNQFNGFNGALNGVRQPTVAPAPSSLDKFYNQGGFGTRLRPVQAPSRVLFPSDTQLSHQSSYRHLSRYAPAKSTQPSDLSAPNHLNPAQQSASFVPVVAVSVTKTSPAPRPGQLSPGNSLLLDDEQQSPELSADLVADYLEMKTGRMNRNKRQQNKQQDDYGNMASGSVSRDLAAPRQPTVPAPTGEQTTTVKSAIFGYLPQDAQKPLMQAISTMLPLASAGHSSSNSIINNNNNNNIINKVNHLTSASDAYVNQVDQVDSSAASNAMLPASDEMLDEPPSLLLQLQANHFAQNDIAHPFGQRPKPNYNDALYSAQGPAAFQLVPADSQAAQALMSPLLGATHPALLASASELNPLLSAAAFQRLQPRPASATDEPSQAQGGANNQDEETGESSISKTKKRSSEFFASAGQLLLSALPLLLAPTLGLMFASGPALPVARYQAPGGGGSLTTGSGSMHTSIPGNYINGQVSQAVPAHVFTPNPPTLYNATSTTTTTTSRPTTSAAFIKPVGQRVQVQSSAGSLVAARNRPTSPPPSPQQPHHLTMTLTTLGPPVFTETSAASALELSEPTSGDQQPAELISYSAGNISRPSGEPQHLHHHHHHVGNTILLLANNLQDAENSTGTRLLANKSSSEGVKYDLSGYEGADFDAQFANLNQRRGVMMSNNSSGGNNRTYPVETGDSMLELASSYADLSSTTRRGTNSTSSANGTNTSNSNNNNNNRLYPVSTWPPMRRRTVSVVTLNGNKTFSDASDRYQAGSSPVMLDYPNNNKRSPSSFGANITKVLVAPGKHFAAEQTENSANDLFFSSNQPEFERHESERQMRSSNRTKRSLEAPTKTADVSRQLQGARRVVRVIRRRSKEAAGGSTALATNSISQGNLTGAENQSGDPLRVDASKSKPAHIITAVLAQVEPPTTADEPTPELADGKQQTPDANEDYNGGFGADELGDARLRELILRRKILLDRLASKSSGGAATTTTTSDEANFGAFGRGRFPQPAGGKRRRRLERPRKGLVLTEDTKRALMDFGSLLIKDTLEVEPQAEPLERPPIRIRRRHRDELDAVSPRARRKDAGGWRPTSEPGNRYSANDGLLEQATERSTYVYAPDAADEAAWHRSPPRGSDELLTYGRVNNGNGDGISDGIGPGNSLSLSNNNNNNRFVPDRASLIDNDAGPYFGPFGAGDDKASANQDQVGPLLMGDYNGHAGYVTNPADRLNIGPNSRLGWPRQQGHQARRSTQANAGNSNNIDDDFNNHFNHSDRRILAAAGAFGRTGNNNESPPPPPRDHYANGGANGAFAESHGGRRSDAAAAGGFYDLMMRNYPSSSSAPAASSRLYNNGVGFSPGGDPTSAAGSQPGAYNATTYAPNLYVPNHLKHNHHRQQQHYSSADYDRHPAADYPAPPTRSPAYFDNGHTGHHHYPALPAPGSGGQAASLASQHHQRPLQPMTAAAAQQQPPQDRSSVNDYLNRVQFSDTDRDKLMASYLTCDGLLNDNDHCLERLSCEFSDPQNIERANKLDRAVSSILLGHILINNYIEDRFKLRLKSASLFGYTHSGQCSKFVCNKLSRQSNVDNGSSNSNNNSNNIRARA